MVVLGVILMAVVVTIMAVNWAKLISKKSKSELMVLWALFLCSLFGLICVVILIILRIIFERRVTGKKIRITFLRIKLISMYVFGLGYLFHCGLYIWKHSSQLEGEDKEKTIVIVLNSKTKTALILIAINVYIYLV